MSFLNVFYDEFKFFFTAFQRSPLTNFKITLQALLFWTFFSTSVTDISRTCGSKSTFCDGYILLNAAKATGWI